MIQIIVQIEISRDTVLKGGSDLDSNWVAVMSNDYAYGQNSYIYQVPTIDDSNSTSDGMTLVRVIAAMEEGIWASILIGVILLIILIHLYQIL